MELLLNKEFQFWTLAFLVFLAIGSQISHQYWTVMRFTNLKKNGWAETQAIMFCSIISIAILVFVFMGETWMALGGAFVEFVINTFYFYVNSQDKVDKRIDEYNQRKLEFEKSREGKPGVKPEFKETVESTLTDREKIEVSMAYFMGFLFPAIIFLLSHYMEKLSDKL